MLMQIIRNRQRILLAEYEVQEIYQKTLKKYMADEVEEIVDGVFSEIGIDIDDDTRAAIIAQSTDRYEKIYKDSDELRMMCKSAISESICGMEPDLKPDIYNAIKDCF